MIKIEIIINNTFFQDIEIQREIENSKFTDKKSSFVS